MKKSDYISDVFSFAQCGDFELENGTKFGPIDVKYEIFGEMNDTKSNVILVLHALTGDSHVTSDYDPPDKKIQGWWDSLIGKNKGVDTNKYCVICSNIFGGCMGTTGPASINDRTGKPYGLTFPHYTIKDVVEVQKKLIDHLGITKLKAIIGGSLGGMNALEWSVLYPEMMESSIVIASAYKTSPQVIAFYEVGRNAILADPCFYDGDYYTKDKKPERGLSIARMIAHVTYLSKSAIEEKFGRDIRSDTLDNDQMYGNFGPMFQIESYLRYQGRKFVDRFDANSYLYITKAMDMYDITKGKDDISEVLSKVKCRTLVISFDTDWHFPPSDSWAIVKAMMKQGKEVSYVNIDSQFGHDAFLIKSDELTRAISGFISLPGAD